MICLLTLRNNGRRVTSNAGTPQYMNMAFTNFRIYEQHFIYCFCQRTISRANEGNVSKSKGAELNVDI